MSFRSKYSKLLTATAILPLLVACGSSDDTGDTSTGGGSPTGGAGSTTGTSSASGTSGSGAGGAGPATSGAGGAGTGGGASGAGGGPVVGDGYPEHTGADCEVTAGGLKKNDNLPNPFVMDDGTAITTKAAWKCRRAEIKAEIEKYEIGPKPEPPKVEASVSGNKLNVVVTTAAGSITLTSDIGGSGSCVAIGMNGNAGLISGCTQIPFMHDQVVGYDGGSGSHSQSNPFYKVYPDLWGKIGKYNAWSWGISRLIDGIEQVKDELNVDPTKIGLQGCSYAGKMALFGGAFDERVALTVAQESGGGGITSWRTSQDFTTRTGTNIEKIDNTNGSWFLGSMKQLDPYSLPHDHHELIAMIAPRAVIALGNQDFEWLGDESGWKSVNAAKEVWKAMGVPENIGFDFTSNHGHCAAPAAQQASVKAFVDKFLKGMNAETEIVIRPQEGNFDLDFTNVIDWETPALR
ncbi:alpha/beta hydrolase family protein [Sorangium sp. So ce590]|uniref:alpha/beta hydrolase family protein n=1 Tax=unclassified Sorangium TaxID=2621164 RepID=UPI003F620193